MRAGWARWDDAGRFAYGTTHPGAFGNAGELAVGGEQTAVPGLIQRGNININARPRVKNPDGSISTVRSISIEQDGKTYLIPTVVGDRVVSNADAIKHFQQTGEHLGAFTNTQAADAYASNCTSSSRDARCAPLRLRDEPRHVLDGPVPQEVRAMRTGTQYANLNPYNVNFSFQPPSQQTDYYKGVQDVYGIPVADQQAEQQQYQLGGVSRTGFGAYHPWQLGL